MGKESVKFELKKAIKVFDISNFLKRNFLSSVEVIKDNLIHHQKEVSNHILLQYVQPKKNCRIQSTIQKNIKYSYEILFFLTVFIL